MHSLTATRLELPLAKGAEMATINLGVSSQLMENYASGLPVDAHRQFAVAQDSNGEPVIFSIGSDERLYLIVRADETPTGWRQIDLTAGLGAGLKTQTFCMAQSPSGQIALAAALSETADGPSRLFITRRLPNQATQANWEAYPQQWLARPLPPERTGRVARILIGAYDDPAGEPTIIAGTITARGAIHLVVPRADAGEAAWQEAELPWDSKEILDMAVGRVAHLKGGRGIYTLFRNTAGELGLQFITFRDKYNRSANCALTPPPGARALAVSAGDGATTALYVAGDGLYRFGPKNHRVNAQAEVIATQKEVPRASAIGVCEDAEEDGGIAVWAIHRNAATGAQHLIYVTGRKGASPDWQKPSLIRRDAAQFAPLRSQVHLSNQFLVVSTDNRLVYLWQDPETTLWQESQILLQDTGHTVGFTSYVTRLELRDAQGLPVTKAPLQLAASQWTYATLNGKAYVLDNSPITVQPDQRGTITITQRVSSIGTPIYHVSADFLATEVDINPGAGVKEHLTKQSPGELLNATYPDGPRRGQPVMQGKFRTQSNAQAASEALQWLGRLADQSHQSVRSLAGLREAGALAGPVTALRVADLPPEEMSWGVAFGPDGARFLSAPDAGDKLAISSALPGVLGDILEAIRSGLAEVGKFWVKVANDAIVFILELGEQVLQFILKRLEEVLSVINLVLEKTLGITLDDIVAWLGFVFNWEDIKATRNIMVETVNRLLDHGHDEMGRFQSQVDDFFVQLEQQVQKMKQLPDEIQKVDPRRGSSQFEEGIRQILKEDDWNLLQRAMASPLSHWPAYLLQHGGMLLVPDIGGELSPDRALQEAVTHFFEKSIVPQLENLQATYQRLSRDFGGEKKLTPAQLFAQVTGDVLQGVIEALRHLTLGVIELVKDLLHFIKSLMNAELKIPLLSTLYTKYISPGSKLTALDVGALLFAVPVTAIYKLVTKKAPFKPGDSLDRLLPRQGAVAGGNDVGAKVLSYIWGWWGAIASGIAAIVESVIAWTPEMGEGQAIPRPLRRLRTIFNLLCLAPVFTGLLLLTPGPGFEPRKWGLIIPLGGTVLAGVLDEITGPRLVAGLNLTVGIGAFAMAVWEAVEMIQDQETRDDGILAAIQNTFTLGGVAGLQGAALIPAKETTGAIAKGVATALGAVSAEASAFCNVVRLIASHVNDAVHISR